jgi:hypothetical protein
MKLKEEFEEENVVSDEDGKRFFKLFGFDVGRKSAAAQMKKIAKRQTKHNQRIMLFHSLHFLVRSDSKMLS